jgi:hypothetical protein
MDHELHTPLGESYLVTSARFAIATNSKEILTAARKSFGQAVEIESSPVLTMRSGWIPPLTVIRHGRNPIFAVSAIWSML